MRLGLLGLYLILCQTTPWERIEQALKLGDAAALGAFFADYVEANYGDVQGRTSQKEAVEQLAHFFREFPPEKFEYLHRGTPNPTTAYWIGTYQGGGRTFRLYLVLHTPTEGTPRIQTLSFTARE